MPGPENALGRVVVHFPNLYSIFMHDTPSQFAFILDFRHVSHGCVRMEEPLQMVAFLTAFNKKDNYDDVLVSMGLPPEKDSLRRLEFLKIKADSADAFQPIPEKSFRTKIPIPVYLVYFTCGVNPYGGISYYQDGYNRDASMSNPQHRRIKTAPAVQSELKKTVPESYSP
jgi:murein L,D-transpeptidase YcbB/YkuD